VSAPRIGVLGAGLIGRRHAGIIAGSASADLAGIADPAPAAGTVAAELGVPHYAGLDRLLAARPDGVIIATPNALHVEHALACIAARVPVLVEKPLAPDPAEAGRIVRAAETAGVPVLVGHHRRHNPRIAAAAQAIRDGRIGRPVAVHGFTWLTKPADYFAAEWRRQPGAGPILINLIHDIDLMRLFCGAIATVQAQISNAVRGHAVEDTAVVTLGFESGALGTMTLSDTAAGPWSWELTAAENPDYPATGQSCYQIAGTEGALEVPNLRLWRYPRAVSWHAPVEPVAIATRDADPLRIQIDHFAQVIRGAAPLVTARDGLAATEAVDAVRRAARDGITIRLGGKAGRS
jgi:predicted dehydrogenase